MGNLVTAAVALGSNLGDRRAHLDFAVSKLHALLSNLRVSRYYQTVPVGVSGPQPLFLNAAAVGETTLSAREMLDALLAIEVPRFRERRFVLEPLADIAPDLVDPVTGQPIANLLKQT